MTPPELRLILVHDGVIRVVEKVGAVHRFAVAHVSAAGLFDDFGGNSQPNLAVDAAPTTMVELVIGLLVYEFIAEELGRLAGGMGYQSLFLG